MSPPPHKPSHISTLHRLVSTFNGLKDKQHRPEDQLGHLPHHRPRELEKVEREVIESHAGDLNNRFRELHTNVQRAEEFLRKVKRTSL
ncbi:hypothetical protein PGTUg99_028927 [Puccinia graminis f. sp. tritici]|uniref:Uncharacterized protein n=1 Tax=Puccinia graminis f. sp. tritici TaxID=56615 RepID=A0A5B0RNG5_PUCGR|nr:hypothetical protein PGTUg99_028927 [Puccinia graminis f. sp. tritici]